MNKEELFQELSRKLSSGEVSRGELLSRFNITSAVPTNGPKNEADSTHFSMTKVLYILGAAIVIIGIAIFVSQVWDDIGSFGHVAVTLGLGFLLTAIGAVLLNQKPEEKIGPVFHAIGGMLIPGGAVVLLHELNIDFANLWPVALTFGVIFIFYLLLDWMQKNAVLTFFAIANGTAFIYLLIQSIIDEPFYLHGDLYAYLTMIIGASYLLLAYAFRGGWNRQLLGALNFFGSLGFLAAGFSRVFDSQPWQMFYFLIVIGGLFLSAYLKTRAILLVSTLFLIAHVSYITGEYFTDSIGWPVALIILGFVFIGLGYVSITINKKYIKQANL